MLEVAMHRPTTPAVATMPTGGDAQRTHNEGMEGEAKRIRKGVVYFDSCDMDHDTFKYHYRLKNRPE